MEVRADFLLLDARASRVWGKTHPTTIVRVPGPGRPETCRFVSFFAQETVPVWSRAAQTASG